MELRGGEPAHLAHSPDARLIRRPSRAGDARPVQLAAVAAIILAVAALARARTFGNPIVHIDEQFYLLVGGRMLHGALPYVDIWDRKPIGLFLIYATVRLLPGTGVVAYQLLALASVCATALILFRLARRVSSNAGALAAALLYVLALDLAGGEGGQAPIFYNLLVTAAIAIIVKARDRPEGPLRRPGAAAMALFGLALQIKYSVVFEGLFAGLVLIGLSLRTGRRPAVLALDIGLWIGCALLPTLLAAACYAGLGHFHDWYFANIGSILRRGSELPATQRMRIVKMSELVVPLALTWPLRRWLGARPADPAARDDLRLLDGWAASALLGVVLFGTWFDHYALPLFAPFAVIAAPLATRRVGCAYLVLLLCVAGVTGQISLMHHRRTRGDGAMLAAATRAAQGRRNCLFVYDGLPALYDSTASCLPTTRPFPAHLQSRNETGATGIDQAGEVRRVMATRPDRVMTMEPAYREENLAARAEIAPVLARDYVELYRYAGGSHRYVVYGLRPGLRRQPGAPSPRLDQPQRANVTTFGMPAPAVRVIRS